MTVFWKPPVNGACVSRYLVSAVASGPYRTSAATATPVKTTELSSVVSGLQNQVSYTFTIQAVSDKAGEGGMASIIGMPSNICKELLPGPVVNLRAKEVGDKFVEVCWDGVNNKACVDEYRVANVPEERALFRDNAEKIISKGGCVKVNNLENGKPYIFYVVPFSAKFGEGQVTQVKATPGAPRALPQVLPSTGPARQFAQGAQDALSSVSRNVIANVQGAGRNLINGALQPFGAALP